jgi:hypothetical protein
MWKRSAKDTGPVDANDQRPDVPGLGVGVQVWVKENVPAASDDWVGEPTGVIISAGDRNLRTVYGPLDSWTTWTVAFSEPQYRRDGRGPYETAVIPAFLLVAAEPAAD